jgi:CRISPR/Cas system CMR-associated protein Cmr5 small subunit
MITVPYRFDEQKDYVYLKKLEVIYIDGDKVAQNSLMKHTVGSINLTFCDLIYTAFDIVESKKFDIILCDMMISPNILKEFFDKYSQKIPIILVSSSKDPKMAYLASKIGAKDYLFKDNEGFKNISKTLHTIHLKWIKDLKQKDSMQLLNDPNMRIVLKDLINTELPITQRTNSSFVSEIRVNDIIKNTYDIQINKILNENPKIVESLVRMDFAKKEYIGQTIACPNCKSVNIFTNYFCGECKNNGFSKEEIFTHIPCGKINIDKISHLEEKLICHHCKIYYVNEPSECSHISGFQCTKCKSTFIHPSVSYSCNNCNLVNFSINDIIWIDLFRYNLQIENLNRIKKSIFFFMDLEHIFKDLGYTIKQYEKFVNDDKPYGPFELIAYKDEEVLLFIILSEDLHYNLSRIFEMDFKSNITNKKIKSFAIAFFEPQDIIFRILKKFDIIPLVRTDDKDLVKEIKNYI